MMKKIWIILNGVLAAAVILLYILHFTGKSGEPETTVSETQNQQDTVLSLAYINIDTVLNNYDYFYDLRDELSEKQSTLESELNSRSKDYEKSASDFQGKIQKGLVTRREAAELEQQLRQEQQNLLRLRDNMSMELAEEEQVMNRKLINSIIEYLEEYNRDGKYDFIFSNSFGDNLLYAKNSLDITDTVIEGLNRSYKRNNPGKDQ